MKFERTWLLALEISPRSSGALQFARWLRGTLSLRVLGVYVHELWQSALMPGDDTACALAVRDETVRWIADLDPGQPGSPIDEARVVDEVDAESGLATAAHGAPALVVGRRVHRETPVVRLGRVTRRLLRKLPAPVIVVPPELAADAFRGPVMLASDLSESSVAAARFAASFAQRLGRPLVCVYVDRPVWDHDPRWADQRNGWKASTERAAREWARDHCPGNELVVEAGDPVEQLIAISARMDACLLVVGSGRPGLLERIFVGSTASAVAATASCAVAVVPADAVIDAP